MGRVASLNFTRTNKINHFEVRELFVFDVQAMSTKFFNGLCQQNTLITLIVLIPCRFLSSPKKLLNCHLIFTYTLIAHFRLKYFFLFLS